MRKLLLITLSLLIVTSASACKPKKIQEQYPTPQQLTDNVNDMTMYLHIGDRTLTATLVDNSATRALRELLAKNPITINMSDYGGFEKIGGLGTTLPTNDERITTKSGDLILYQGNHFAIFYAPNSWSYTRLGKINGVTQEELREALGAGNVTVTLSLTR